MWGMGKKEVLEFRVIALLYVVRGPPSSFVHLSFIYHLSITEFILPYLSLERRREVSCFGIRSLVKKLKKGLSC